VKITDVRVQTVNIPFEAPMLWSGGVNRGWTRAVVRMQTDEGIEGIAETLGGAATDVQIEHVKGFFIGQDPHDLEGVLKNFWWLPTYQGMTGRYAVQALETCCWDIRGKAANRPMCQLIGGRVRREVAFAAYMFYRARDPDTGLGGEITTEQMVEHTRDIVRKHGFETIKLKGGVLPPEEELETTVALRDAFPDHELRFDPNGLWTVETSIRIGKKMEPLDLEYYEDPCWGLEGMHRARKDVRIPFATNMAIVTREQLPVGIRLGAADVILLDPQDWGGPTATLKAAHTCELFQLGVGFHSGGEAGISTALYVQLAASLPVLPHAVDSHYQHQTEDVITQPWVFEHGCLKVPDKPGLGVEIDEDQVARLEERHRKLGDLVFYGHEGDPLNPTYQGMW